MEIHVHTEMERDEIEAEHMAIDSAECPITTHTNWDQNEDPEVENTEVFVTDTDLQDTAQGTQDTQLTTKMATGSYQIAALFTL